MLETKLEIVKALKKGDSQRLVGKKFGIAKSTVADIWRDREKKTDFVASSESPAFTNNKRCVIRHPKFDLVDEACWKWFCQQCSRVLLFCWPCCFKRKSASSLRSFILILIHRASRAAQDGYQSLTQSSELRAYLNYGQSLVPRCLDKRSRIKCNTYMYSKTSYEKWRILF